MRAMILAAGLGTRLKPFTDKHPKALATVNGKTVLERNIRYLQRYGIDEVIVNVHHFADQIVDTLEKNKGWGSRVSISDETNEVLETGGGIQKAREFLEKSSDFLVMNADILTDLPLDKMLEQHTLQKPMGTLAVSDRKSSRYLLFNEPNSLSGWRNEKTGEQKGVTGHPKAFSGIQVLSAAIFGEIRFTGKFSMIDVYLQLCQQFRFNAFDHSDGIFMDIGTEQKLLESATLFP